MPQPVSSATVVSCHLPGIVSTHMAKTSSWELFISVVFATVGPFTLLKTDSNNQMILSLLLHGPSHHCTAGKQWMGYSSSLPSLARLMEVSLESISKAVFLNS